MREQLLQEAASARKEDQTIKKVSESKNKRDFFEGKYLFFLVPWENGGLFLQIESL